MDLGRLLILVLVGGLAIVGYSQLAEDTTLEERAQETACEGHPCTAELQRRHRDLFGWTYYYTTYADRVRRVRVACARPLWVFGEYACDIAEANSAGDGRFRPP